ncbi:radical SAM protein [Patescibacteria group bacterium]|nr:radical SAM protein [Patescibacteria group bacterium]
MIKITEIKAKSIIAKSGLPDSDFVINPYRGCQHGCLYCYAKFMARFSNHHGPWGRFLDVKINAADLIPQNTNKYKNKSIVMASVTDPYQPMERKYKLTREILTKLIPLKPKLCMLTKSDLIVRDIDLLKKFDQCSAGISLSLLDDQIRKEVESGASAVEQRINALKELKKAKIFTVLFMSPLLPELSPWPEIILKTKKFVDEFWFENLNVKADNWLELSIWLKKKYPRLLKKYREIYFTKNNYWPKLKQQIKQFCQNNRVRHQIYFH